MCTALSYKTKGTYFGRNFDYEFSYGEEIVITSRNYSFNFRYTKPQYFNTSKSINSIKTA